LPPLFLFCSRATVRVGRADNLAFVVNLEGLDAVCDFVENHQRDAFRETLVARQAIGIGNQGPVSGVGVADAVCNLGVNRPLNLLNFTDRDMVN
jgi:hypothetical protein